MQFHPMKALITRDQDDALHEVPGMIAGEPQIGVPLQLFLETGKVMRTTAVQRVSHEGSELIVDTANSRYHLKLSEAA